MTAPLWTSEPLTGGYHWARMPGMYNDRGDVEAYHVEIVKVFYFREGWHLVKFNSLHHFTAADCGFTGFCGPIKIPSPWGT